MEWLVIALIVLPIAFVVSLARHRMSMFERFVRRLAESRKLRRSARFAPSAERMELPFLRLPLLAMPLGLLGGIGASRVTLDGSDKGSVRTSHWSG
jgi:hypothetical protein